MKPRIVFAGTPAFGATVLRGALDAGWEVPLVVTRPDRPAGRGGKNTPSAVTRLAQEQSLPIAKPPQAKDILPQIKDAAPDVLIVASYGEILPPEVLTAPKSGSVNIHASLLPKYRGASPIQQVLLDGESQTGVTLMQMDEGLDTGPIIAFARQPIAAADTAGSLSEKLAALGARLLVETLPRFLAGEVAARPQDESQATMTRVLKKSDGRIDWTQPAEHLERFVRAMQPWPTAWTTIGDDSVQVLESSPAEANLKPGAFNPKGPLVVGTGSGALRVGKLRLAGKGPVDGASFLRGYRGEPKFG